MDSNFSSHREIIRRIHGLIVFNFNLQAIVPYRYVTLCYSPSPVRTEDGYKDVLKNRRVALLDYWASRSIFDSCAIFFCSFLLICEALMTVLWDVAPCGMVDVYKRFRGLCCLLHQGDDFWNVGKLLPDCTALQPTRQPFSYSSPLEP